LARSKISNSEELVLAVVARDGAPMRVVVPLKWQRPFLSEGQRAG
jgi:hypothetical protein